MDTGASRSVIGSENLPSMMQLLDPATRDRVKEKLSRIVFRLGNNQIEHSFKQIWIPIRSEKHQIWLIVEVVPKHTPFLLSIQTMRKLGAVLNLEKNTCFLQTLGRSIPMRVGKTGLLMISMADLCQSSSMSAFVASRLVKSLESSSADRHAHSKGSHGDDQGDSRNRDAVASDSADSVDESSSNSGGRTSRATGAQRTCPTAPDIDARSSWTKGHVAGDLKEPEDRGQLSDSPPPGLRMVRRSVGKRDSHLGRRDATVCRLQQNSESKQSSSTDAGPDDCKLAQDSKPGSPSWHQWRPLPTDRDTQEAEHCTSMSRFTFGRREHPGRWVQCTVHPTDATWHGRKMQ